MAKKFQRMDDDNPFSQGEELSLTEADAMLYGSVDLPSSGRITAKPIAIDTIAPDRTQPRQQMPRELRKGWDGKPSSLPRLLDQWAQMAGLSASLVAEIIRGSKSVHDVPGDEPELAGLLKVLNIASSVHDIGLQSPITVIKLGKDGYQVVFGERRWMAFQALTHWLEDEQYAKIPAKVADMSAWEARKIQSAENNQRDELSAIGKARQFAVLLMDAREQFADASYEPLSAFGDEWAYYSQVSNGNEHGIPYGMGKEFEAAMGISTGQMRQYRTLLSIYSVPEVDRQLWNTADDNGWSERFLRDIYTHLGASQVQSILRSVTTVTVLEESLRDAISEAKARKRAQKQAVSPPPPVATSAPEPQRVPREPGIGRGASQLIGQVVADGDGNQYTVLDIGADGDLLVDYDGEEHVLPISEVEMDAPAGPPKDAKPVMSAATLSNRYLGEKVTLHTGKEGTVVEVKTGMVCVELDDGVRPWVSPEQIIGIITRPASVPSPRTQAIDARENKYESSNMGATKVPSWMPDSPEVGTDDASDNGLSGEGAEAEFLLTGTHRKVSSALTGVKVLADNIGMSDERASIQTLQILDTDDLQRLAGMSEEDAENVLVLYEQAIIRVMEEALGEIEKYTMQLRERVKDVRADGA